MYALESDPERSRRWRRFGIGAGVSVVLAVTAALVAQRVTPVARALHDVVEIAVVDEKTPEPQKPAEAPPPEPPRARTQPKTRSAVPPPNAPPPPADAPPPPLERVGLDADSFGSGSGGPAFQAGTTQMGRPTRVYAAAAPPPPKKPLLPPVFKEARPVSGELMRYPEWARQKNVQGLIVVEVDIDERGRVTRAVVRRHLDPKLDADVQRAIESTVFAPARLGGRAIASTRFLRVRFKLE